MPGRRSRISGGTARERRDHRRILGGPARAATSCWPTRAPLVAGSRARDFKEGAQLAAHAIDSGAARGKLNMVRLSHELAQDKA